MKKEGNHVFNKIGLVITTVFLSSCATTSSLSQSEDLSSAVISSVSSNSSLTSSSSPIRSSLVAPSSSFAPLSSSASNSSSETISSSEYQTETVPVSIEELETLNEDVLSRINLVYKATKRIEYDSKATTDKYELQFFNDCFGHPVIL